jgi:hypothetical protein
MSREWTDVWPKETGWYWVYGGYDSIRCPMKEPKLNTMQVIRISNGLSYIVGNGFVYPSDYKAVFMPMDLPDLPE